MRELALFQTHNISESLLEVKQKTYSKSIYISDIVYFPSRTLKDSKIN